MSKRALVGASAAAIVASLPVAAARATPTQAQYGNGLRTPPASTADAGQSSSQLPFTGLEIGLIVAGGAAAAGAGLALRRGTRGRQS